MGIKNEVWALGQLREFIRLNERIPDRKNPGKEKLRGSLQKRQAQHLVVRHIWEAMWGEWPYSVSTRDALRCIFEIERGAEMRENLDLVDGPRIGAEDLHPWVWSAAKPHWESDNHDASIWAASINVNSRIQKKVGISDISEVKLVQAVFSLDGPKSGRPRLRLCDESNPAKFKDMHVGASQLGSGLYAGVRNTVNHLPPDETALTTQTVLECLASFSLFARWVDQAEVVSTQ